MAVRIYSCQNQGLKAHLIETEVDILPGLSAFSIVGLGIRQSRRPKSEYDQQ